jgi:hypothetical protein
MSDKTLEVQAWLVSMIDAKNPECPYKLANAELARLDDLINTPHTNDFLEAVKLEAAHQRERWGDAHDRSKSAENWFFLVGYLGGKALRAAIDGDREKALHHTISSAAALMQWHHAILEDRTGRGVGEDLDLQPGGTE